MVPFKGLDHGYMKNANLIFKPRYLSDKIASFGLEFKKPEYIISFMYDFSIANSAVNSNVVNAYEFQIGYTKNLFKPKQDKKKIIMDDQYIVGDERILNKPKELIIIRDTVFVEDTIKIVEKGWSEKLKDPERKITFNYKSEKFEEEDKKELDEIVKLLKSNNDYVIEIEGHTDNIGDAESNKRQSLRRAQAISDYLVKQDITKSRIRVSGRGANKPIATNATEEGRAKNRRVVFRLYKLVK
jgi:outer membrane protein OmpA-like peptidoglycan-associated protein